MPWVTTCFLSDRKKQVKEPPGQPQQELVVKASHVDVGDLHAMLMEEALRRICIECTRPRSVEGSRMTKMSLEIHVGHVLRRCRLRGPGTRVH